MQSSIAGMAATPLGGSLMSGSIQSDDDISFWHKLGLATGGAFQFPERAGYDTLNWRSQWQADRARYNGCGKHCDDVDDYLERCRVTQAAINDAAENLKTAYLALRQLDSGATLQTANKCAITSGKILQLLAKLSGATPDAGWLSGLVNNSTVNKPHDAIAAAEGLVKAYKDAEVLYKWVVDQSAIYTELVLKGDFTKAKTLQKELKANAKALATILDRLGSSSLGKGMIGFIADKKGFSSLYSIVDTVAALFDYADQLEALNKEANLGVRTMNQAQFAYLQILRSHAALMANLHQAVGQCCGPEGPKLPDDANNTNDGSSGSGQGAHVTMVGSIDPNDKVTVGYGSQNFITGSHRLFYVIHFENKTSASAPAQRVEVTDFLSAALDWSTSLHATGARLRDRPEAAEEVRQTVLQIDGVRTENPRDPGEGAQGCAGTRQEEEKSGRGRGRRLDAPLQTSPGPSLVRRGTLRCPRAHAAIAATLPAVARASLTMRSMSSATVGMSWMRPTPWPHGMSESLTSPVL